MSAVNVKYEGGSYSKFRPSYSDEIYSRIYAFHDEKHGKYDLLVDVGTGTGQAAIELCKKFKSVHGIDSLEEQIKNATKRDNIEYHVGPGEDLSRFEDNSVDMITVGTAFHWFDHAKFFKEAKRALKQGTGTLAVFGYYYPVISKVGANGKADGLAKVNELVKDLLVKFDQYTNPNIKYVKSMYRNIDFPFKEQTWYITPKSEDITNISESVAKSLMEASMDMETYRNYMKTASAYANYMEAHPNDDPVEKLTNDIKHALNITDQDIVHLEWPTSLVLARND
ncbi:S-adenosyl-L-methionine-dependent methyltransferase [Parasitella parasitica]|nr:S-adenosyl-L-methionine-dependent methyltransferase [Parasitella parasitica]